MKPWITMGKTVDSKTIVQMVWGVALMLAGILMLINIPSKIAEIERQFSSGISFLKFSFYLISVLLIGGGAKKIHHAIKQSNSQD